MLSRRPSSPLFPYTTLFRSQNHVQRENERAHADAELRPAARSVEARGEEDVVREDEEKDHRDVEEIAVNVLQDERECALDRKSTRLNSSHLGISYAVFCLKK